MLRPILFLFYFYLGTILGFKNCVFLKCLLVECRGNLQYIIFNMEAFYNVHENSKTHTLLIWTKHCNMPASSSTFQCYFSPPPPKKKNLNCTPSLLQVSSILQAEQQKQLLEPYLLYIKIHIYSSLYKINFTCVGKTRYKSSEQYVTSQVMFFCLLKDF